MRYGPSVKPGMSSAEVNDLYGSMRDANRIIESRRDASPSTLKKIGERVVDTAEVVAGAAAIGFVAGRTGSTTIGPVPTGLAVAAAYYTAEAFDFVPGAWSRHLENVLGKGALAGYATMWAAGQGYLMKQDAEGKAAQPKKPGEVKGLPPGVGGMLSSFSGQPAHQPNMASRFAGTPQLSAARPNQMGCPPPGALTEAELQAIMQKRQQQR
jgi:hypothetical protein